MAIDASVALTNTNAVAFPGTESVNASGPTAVDGTEYVKVLIDNYMMGPQQALLNFAGLTPDGLPEEDGASQELEALQKSFGYPGEAVNWYGDLDPAVVGARILLLHGQGVLISQYPELTVSTYVGDGNNATAPAFYKADDAAGTIRNIAGIYLILPDARDVYPLFRGESVFSAKIANNGVATIVSESSIFIGTVNRTAAGVVSIVFAAGFFTVAPVIVSMVTASLSVLAVESVPITTTGVTIGTRNDGGGTFDSNIDADINIVLQRQETDYNPFGDDFIEPGIRY